MGEGEEVSERSWFRLFPQLVGRAMQQGGFVKGSHVEKPTLASLPSHTQQSRKVPTCSDHLFSSLHTALHRPLFHIHATTTMSGLQLLLLHISSRSNFEGAVGLEDVQVILGDIAVEETEQEKARRRRMNWTSRPRR